MPKRALVILVERGPDVGARLPVDTTTRVVGRAREVDLVLRDLCVSRRHLNVVAASNGVEVHVCNGAAPIIVRRAHKAGRRGTTAERSEEVGSLHAVAACGDRILVGDTTLRVASMEETSAKSPEYEPAEVDTLLNGAALDVRGLAAIYALVEALDCARDFGAIEESLGRWAREYADSREAVLELDDKLRVPDPLRPNQVLVRRQAAGASVTVPAHASSTGWLTFRLSPDKLTDSLQRLLVVAGRICASRLAHVRALVAVAEERESMRCIAFGGARGFLGESPAAQRITKLLPRLAASDAPVLLTGETGTGKTFIARLLHELGPRAGEPLRIVNCAAIPETLIESELFGYERGAFTGATASRVGALEAAGGGTLLLDEIGELSLAGQAKLLRALDELRFERLGSNRCISLRARVVAATNRDLAAMVEAGTFRSDLVFRISVVKLHVPAARERGDDLVLLARQILSDLGSVAGRRVEGFSAEALDAIRRYSWPGNVRELRNAIEHAMVLGDGAWIEAYDLPAAIANGGKRRSPDDTTHVALPANLAWLERRAIQAALSATGGNRSRAAALLGINRQTLYNKLADLENGSNGQ